MRQIKLAGILKYKRITHSRSCVNQREKKWTSHQVDFAVLADYRVKIKESKKIKTILGSC